MHRSRHLASLWPKTWNAVQVLLKEEEYEDAKQYQVCICRKEKRTEADSGISKNYSYSGKYSVIENKDDLCPHYTTKVVVFESDIVISTSIHTM